MAFACMEILLPLLQQVILLTPVKLQKGCLVYSDEVGVRSHRITLETCPNRIVNFPYFKMYNNGALKIISSLRQPQALGKITKLFRLWLLLSLYFVSVVCL